MRELSACAFLGTEANPRGCGKQLTYGVPLPSGAEPSPRVRGAGRMAVHGPSCAPVLQDGEIRIEVEGWPRWSSGVKFSWSEAEPTQEIDVINEQGAPLARISAGEHADVVAIPRSGLPITATPDGTWLLKSRVRGER